MSAVLRLAKAYIWAQVTISPQLQHLPGTGVYIILHQLKAQAST